jgi:nucleotide-binding universal stress UspA family protein
MLPSISLPFNVLHQGDVKSALTAFCSSEDIELLVIGTRSGGKIKKRLG